MKSSYEGTYIAADGHRYPDGEGPDFEGPVRPWATGRRKKSHLREDETPQPVPATLDGVVPDPAEDDRGFWEPQGSGRPASGSLITDEQRQSAPSEPDPAVDVDASAQASVDPNQADEATGTDEANNEGAGSDDDRDSSGGDDAGDATDASGDEGANTEQGEPEKPSEAGQGEGGGEAAGGDAEPTVEDQLARIDELKRQELVDLAEHLNVEHAKSATKDDIIAAIKSHQESQA